MAQTAPGLGSLPEEAIRYYESGREAARLFSTACFHGPGELGAGLQEAGLIHQNTLAIQEPGWLVPDFEEKWASDAQREALLLVIRPLERDPAAQAMTPHLMAIGRKSQGSGDKEPRPPADPDAGDGVSRSALG